MRHALYGIVRNEADAAERVAALAAGPSLRLVTSGDLGAVVSLTPDATQPCEGLYEPSQGFSGPSQGPDPTVHAQVVQALHAVRAVLPMRHGISFESEAEVRDMLREHGALFRRALNDLQGCGEMGVRAICRPAATAPSGGPAVRQAALSPARAYLAARQSRYAARDAADQEVTQLGERMEAAFRGLFARCKTESFALRDHQVLSLHFLVRREDTPRFRDAFRRLEESAPEKLLLTGPWPPYNFACCETMGDMGAMGLMGKKPSAAVESAPETGAGSIAAVQFAQAAAPAARDSAQSERASRDLEIIRERGTTVAYQ